MIVTKSPTCTCQRLPPAGPDSVEPFSNFPLFNFALPSSPLLLIPEFRHECAYIPLLGITLMKHSTFSADTPSITIHSPASLADHRNDRRHQVLLKIRPPRHGISLDYVSGAFRPKVEPTTNSPSFSITPNAQWETSAAIRPMFIQGSRCTLTVPAHPIHGRTDTMYGRKSRQSTSGNTIRMTAPWTFLDLAGKAGADLSSICWPRTPYASYQLPLRPYLARLPFNDARLRTVPPSDSHGAWATTNAHTSSPCCLASHTPASSQLLPYQLATERVSVPTAFTPHAVAVVAAQPRAAIMMTATSRNLELLRAGERGEGQEVYSRCVVEGVVSRRTHTLSVNHNQSGTFAFHFRPLEPRLLHESYPYLLVGSPAPSNGFMGPMSLAVGVDDVGPLAPSPTPRPPAAAPKSNKSRLPYCPSAASVLFVYPSASSRASPSAPRTSLDVCSIRVGGGSRSITRVQGHPSVGKKLRHFRLARQSAQPPACATAPRCSSKKTALTGLRLESHLALSLDDAGSTWAMESVMAAAGDGERGGSAESKPALKAAIDMQRRPSHGGWGCQALGLRPGKRSLDRSTTTGWTVLLEPFPTIPCRSPLGRSQKSL
ncbi:hypothetical protein CFIO01_07297 [Colletotrichum fioriniae PJ7]|uniref:Uncharacterized protein n=1 Tax=Colletotrichum fioriniae PJ7 TaxID=1445577 RepID=A0A010QSG0_9PEZI|nr:hypothetical protein CFIO01_07297 [Colletotrichum fioriniae PJ7]